MSRNLYAIVLVILVGLCLLLGFLFFQQRGDNEALAKKVSYLELLDETERRTYHQMRILERAVWIIRLELRDRRLSYLESRCSLNDDQFKRWSSKDRKLEIQLTPIENKIDEIPLAWSPDLTEGKLHAHARKVKRLQEEIIPELDRIENEVKELYLLPTK